MPVGERSRRSAIENLAYIKIRYANQNIIKTSNKL
jgi:hypothetical protein